MLVLSKTGRKMCVAAGLLIIGSLLFPWWGMKLIAPQYPEGLDVIVYPYQITGDLDIVNTLNHYIGMEDIDPDSIPELKLVPVFIGVTGIFLLFAAYTRRIYFVVLSLILLFIGGGVGLWDLNRWLTNYGSNLAPTAPIKIEPFVPPIMGSNQLANFITYTSFRVGAFMVLVALALLLYVIWKGRERVHQPLKALFRGKVN